MFSTTLNAPRRAVAEYDNVLTWIVTALLAIGLVMVYSASIATAEAGKYTNYQPTYYLVRHGIFILTGIVAGVLAFQIPTQMWQKYSPYLFLIGVVLLIVVLIPHVGKAVNGSRRWLPLLIVNLQPSELMKLFAVLYAADYAVRKGAVKDHLLATVPADVRGDGAGRRAVAAGTGHGRVCGDLRDCDGYAVAGRFQPEDFRRAGGIAAAGIWGADIFLRLPHAARHWFHGSRGPIPTAKATNSVTR